MADRIRLDYSNMLAVDNGILNEIDSIKDEIEEAAAGVQQKKRENLQGFFHLPYQTKVKEDVKAHARYIRENFENFVVVGIGGSALGNSFLHKALNHPYYNVLSHQERKGCPRVFILDSIDTDYYAGLLDVLDLKKTAFNVITKSGSTSETMANFMVMKDKLEKAVGREKAKDRIIATTDREKGNLLNIALEEGYKTFYIPANVGGRYSVLSPVGLLSAAVSGIDIDDLLAGAADMAERCNSVDPFINPALLGAVFQYLANKKGKNISVVMPYTEFLDGFGDWYCQLWAESLGKSINVGDTEKEIGQTPVKAIGARDQHSLLQLFLDGPNDKIFTLISVENRNTDFEIPSINREDIGINYLSGNTIGKLLSSEFQATGYVLTKRSRMNYQIKLPKITPGTIGQLIFLYMSMTAHEGELLKLDAFNQPAVEEGKVITYGLMKRKGFENKGEEINKWEKDKKNAYA